MDRRSGLKKAHFSSVPTRMRCFTCKKYVFLIEKNFPHPKIGKTQHNALSYVSCVKPSRYFFYIRPY
ncbi:Hypothetical protein G436_0305 [Leptospira interrogans serovar Hardjo str. Norma]|uniref:Uncharacterized protein n=1 Tax=Leptospira interrogans serovar Hardjo str. Norma TaxID=1279460 RepID=A0A0M4N2F8_LEPIR|nr:Hypothetical protein G436_0305 [Leptospira interrogans serovar Hardjo str. Norma]